MFIACLARACRHFHGLADNFGRSVSVNGDGSLIAIGSVSAAAVFAYDTDGSSWLSGSAVGPRDGSNTDAFGSAVALSPDGTWLVVGDPTCSGPSPVGDGPIVAYGCLETFSGSGDVRFFFFYFAWVYGTAGSSIL